MASAAITVNRQPVSLANVPTHTARIGVGGVVSSAADLLAALEHNRPGVRR